MLPILAYFLKMQKLSDLSFDPIRSIKAEEEVNIGSKQTKTKSQKNTAVGKRRSRKIEKKRPCAERDWGGKEKGSKTGAFNLSKGLEDRALQKKEGKPLTLARRSLKAPGNASSTCAVITHACIGSHMNAHVCMTMVMTSIRAILRQNPNRGGGWLLRWSSWSSSPRE